jgi:decaprenyl-phosphate phosphoribosyltransferase
MIKNALYKTQSSIQIDARPPTYPLLVACRPRQWTKNLLVFAAPLFAFKIQPQVWGSALLSGVCFCALSSAIYLVNDLMDREVDRQHPRKRYRPIAAGWVSPRQAIAAALLLAGSSLGLAAFLNLALMLVLLTYGLIQVAYTLRLKRLPLLDICCISAGFLLRAVAGGVAAGLLLSPWFLLTVGLLALFLAIEKRKAELRLSQASGAVTRSVLERYSLPLLLRLESMVSTSAFMSYALWSAGPALKGAPSSLMLVTLPFVLVGIFRYQLLSDPDEAERRQNWGLGTSTERPEDILLRDGGIQLAILGWLITVVAVSCAYHLHWVGV